MYFSQNIVTGFVAGAEVCQGRHVVIRGQPLNNTGRPARRVLSQGASRLTGYSWYALNALHTNQFVSDITREEAPLGECVNILWELAYQWRASLAWRITGIKIQSSLVNKERLMTREMGDWDERWWRVKGPWERDRRIGRLIGMLIACSPSVSYLPLSLSTGDEPRIALIFTLQHRIVCIGYSMCVISLL